jgi:DNA-directed RNA polymerase specialized sigma subunit|nr:sigma-70 family RNA polymerase sigma factor [uncultured Blautia sp.]
MAKDHYYIKADGQIFEVSQELYEVYYRGRRKEKYFMHDLKEERVLVDRETGQIRVLPGKEDSYERLLAMERQFMGEEEDVADAAVRAVMLERLSEVLEALDRDELEIIYALFYQEVSEVALARELGIARTTLQYRKKRILEKLRELL